MTNKTPSNPNLIIPAGTQIVTRIEIKASNGIILCPHGAIGVIIDAPTDNSHNYKVKFLNDVEANLRRHEFYLRKHFQKVEEIGDQLNDFQLENNVIYRCIVGSKAYGLDNEDSDTDRRGIYLPSAELHWSLYGIPEQLIHKETDECYWELQKFLVLALKANPNILECLYSPLVETVTPLAQELLDIRSIFLSKLVYATYNGYVISQFKKMEQDLRNKGEIKPKHAMHLIRLLLSGIKILEEGFVPVRIEEYREELLAIRNSQASWKETNYWRLSLHKDFEQAFTKSSLPSRPDYERANAFLIKARRHQVNA